jgi:hypothetical protein
VNRPMTVVVEIVVPMVHDVESAAADNALGMITDHMKALGFPWHIDDVYADEGGAA